MELRKNDKNEYVIILDKKDIDVVIDIFKSITPNYDRYLPLQNDDLWSRLLLRYTVDRVLDKLELNKNIPILLTIINGNSKFIVSITDVEQNYDENNMVRGIMYGEIINTKIVKEV